MRLAGASANDLQTRPAKYRLYIDEVGNTDLKPTLKPEQRYLSLTGIAIALDHERDVVFPALEALKQRFFDSHPDEPVVLHRRELISQKPPFHALRDPEVDAAFRAELLGLLEDLDYVVITATIDKLRHLSQYRAWQKHPYHYCLAVILERFTYWLRNRGVGDVMAESRGANEDRLLKTEYERIWTYGTEYKRPQELQAGLTSRQLKVRNKQANVAGLQLADLLAYPSWRWMLAQQRGVELDPEHVNGQIAQILVLGKYRRSPNGTIAGHGCKWLP